MVCARCGQAVAENAIFCAHCGQRLADNNEAPPNLQSLRQRIVVAANQKVKVSV